MLIICLTKKDKLDGGGGENKRQCNELWVSIRFMVICCPQLGHHCGL